MSETEKIRCPMCGEEYSHYRNIYGKICIVCGEYINIDGEPEFKKTNDERQKELQRKVIEHIKGKNHGN